MENDPDRVNGINETTIPYAILERLEAIHREAQLTRRAVERLVTQTYSRSNEEDKQDSGE